MILECGTKILVAHRRLYEGDHSRYFAGVVEAYEDGIARVYGHTWLRDAYVGAFKRKDDERTKILSLSSCTVLVYQLPSSVDLGSLDLHIDGADVMLRDELGFQMDLTEGVLRSGRPLEEAA